MPLVASVHYWRRQIELRARGSFGGLLHRQAHLPRGYLDYRHTFGSQLAMNGESLYKFSPLMENSREICRRHYTALIPEALAETAEFSSMPLRKSFSIGG